MKKSTCLLLAMLSFTLMTCREDYPIQTPTEMKGTPHSLQKAGPPPPPPMPPVVGVWGACWSHAYLLKSTYPYLKSEVARLAAGPDGDPNSSNLKAWMQVGQNAGFTFFLYQFPETVIQNIGTWGRPWIINRIDSVYSWLLPGQYCSVEVDDVDYIGPQGHKYNSSELDSLKWIIGWMGKKDLIYGTASSADPILNHVDHIMADAYSNTNRPALYSQMQQFNKPLHVWISIEKGTFWACNACAIRDQLEDARGYATDQWVFADFHCPTSDSCLDEYSNHQYDSLRTALSMSQRCP